MLLNEIAQWTALVFLGVFVLGLLRQLGDSVVPPRERVSRNRGPDLGTRLSDELLTAAERQRLGALMEERGTEWAALVVVSEECSRCHALLDELSVAGAPDGAPVAALSSKSGPDHAALLERAADVAIVDPERLEAAELHVKPFTLIVDRSFKVVHKQLANDLAEAVRGWDGRNGRRRRIRRDERGPEMTVLHIGGEGERS